MSNDHDEYSVVEPPAPNPRPVRIALVAGEASGDVLGAGLIEQLNLRYPNAVFAGVGGGKMRAAGLDAWHDCGELAVMGLAEVLRHLPRLLRLRSALRQRLLAWKPDIFIGIDAPDFNLGLERWLKQRSVLTAHYVSPSIWAWREGRAAKIGRSASRVLCLFPMEPPIYQRHGVDARYVGHPLADAIPLHPDREAARHALGVPGQGPLLAVLPGSRLSEIQRLLPVFLQAAKRLTMTMPTLGLLIPAANDACRNLIEQLLIEHALASAAIFDHRAHEVLIASDVALVASGTASLEAMLAKRPMVVAYRLSGLTYRIVMALGLLKTSRYSLPNVLANEPIVPELMQHDCTPGNVAEAVQHWFQHPEAVNMLQPRFEYIHRKLRVHGSARAADAIAEMLAGK